RNDCRFVCGTTSKVQRVAPELAGSSSGSPGLTVSVTVPDHVPLRNDVGGDGAVGPGLDPPQADRTNRRGTGPHQRATRIMTRLLPCRVATCLRSAPA